ncbi:MAG: DUF1080 domain-containing protein [Burkholderiales bacterium]|nr:DUF1080 domain-containing protein [Opitutaceae bacterium]
MNLKLLLLPLLLVPMSLPALAQTAWRPLFNGQDLAGWKANAYPDSWSVVDGAIRAHATKSCSHLFYVGDHADGFERFKDFELEVESRSEPDSNSGVFIHTDHATHPDGMLRLLNGYEIQLNSSAIEKRKTGSLYAVVDLDVSPVDESQWFTTRITVRGQRITVHLNDRLVVDYTEPANVERPKDRAGRRLNPLGAAIALQGHDPKSVFYFRSIKIRTLDAPASTSAQTTLR